MPELTAEKFLRKKLESEISVFGDGTAEFHTRDVQHLLICLDDKDGVISQIRGECAELQSRIDFNFENEFNELLALCMTINNLSAEERLRYIRNKYKNIVIK
jgi:hypothetical protein